MWRFVELPVQVTSSFTGTARQSYPQDILNSDAINADQSILLVAKKIVSGMDTLFIWDLGDKNYLADLSYSGGDAGGGNVEVTLSYQNDFSDAVLAKDSFVASLSSSTTF